MFKNKHISTRKCRSTCSVFVSTGESIVLESLNLHNSRTCDVEKGTEKGHKVCKNKKNWLTNVDFIEKA